MKSFNKSKNNKPVVPMDLDHELPKLHQDPNVAVIDMQHIVELAVVTNLFGPKNIQI